MGRGHAYSQSENSLAVTTGLGLNQSAVLVKQQQQQQQHSALRIYLRSSERPSPGHEFFFFFCTIIRIVLKNMEINRVGEHGAQRDSQPRGREGTVPECERERESAGSRCCCEGTQNSIQNARLL